MIGYKLVDPKAKPPRKATEGACGFDLTCVSVKQHRPNVLEYDTGISLQLPDSIAGLVLPRSSISNMDLMLCNSVGLIDSDYRGTIKLRFFVTGDNVYRVGERIGQIMFVPCANLEEDLMTMEELKETVRGEGGFGSTNDDQN